jgi:hypothetical protein
MHCYENALLRNWLFERVREIDPQARRDDLLIEQVLADNGIGDLAVLCSLGAEEARCLAAQIVGDIPLAA